jgi:hypothetical protein
MVYKRFFQFVSKRLVRFSFFNTVFTAGLLYTSHVKGWKSGLAFSGLHGTSVKLAEYHLVDLEKNQGNSI